MLSWLGGPVKRRLATWGGQLQQINAFEPILAAEDNRDLRKRSLALRYRAKAGEPLSSLVPEGYALVLRSRVPDRSYRCLPTAAAQMRAAP